MEIVVEVAMGMIANIATTVVVALVKDLTGSKNNRLTRRQPASIEKIDIMVAGDKPFIGVYFVPTKGGKENWVGFDALIDNKPGLIKFDVPGDLVDGTYDLDVVTQWNSRGELSAEPRRVRVGRKLRVSKSVPVGEKDRKRSKKKG